MLFNKQKKFDLQCKILAFNAKQGFTNIFVLHFSGVVLHVDWMDIVSTQQLVTVACDLTAGHSVVTVYLEDSPNVNARTRFKDKEKNTIRVNIK